MPMLCALNGMAPVDLPVLSCTWSHASTKQDGSATVLVPYTSAAYTANHIDERRAFPVLLLSRLGRWDGICLKVRGSSAGCVLECVSQSRLLEAAITARSRTLENLTAGAIMRTVVAQTFGSIAGPGLNAGTFALLPPVISRFELDGGTVGSVASTLQDLTHQEPQVTAGTFNWLPAVAAAYGTLLVEGDALTSPERSIEHDDSLTYLVSRTDTGQEERVRAAESAGVWQREQLFTTTAGTRRVRRIEAAAELNDARMPRVTLAVGLRDTGSHWATLREGMAIDALTPTVGFSKQIATYRVLRRTYTEGSPILGLELWHLPKPETAGVAGFGSFIPSVVRPSGTDAYNQIHELIKIRSPFELRNPIGSLG
jgi:hypothetical protein